METSQCWQTHYPHSSDYFHRALVLTLAYYLMGFFLYYFLSITVGDPASEICSREEALLKLSELLQVEIAFQWSYSLRNMFHESLRCCGHMVRKSSQKSPKLWLGNIVQW